MPTATPETLRAAVDDALAAYLARPELAARLDVGGGAVLEELRGFVSGGGKRFRPLLVLGAWAQFGPGEGVSEGAALDAAVGIELFHTFLLVHDDVMDHAEVRRGHATLRRRLARRWPDAPESIGDHLSIVAGDVCFALAMERFNSLEAPAETVRALVGMVLDYAVQTGAGQLLDVLHAVHPAGAVSHAEIERCYDLKTARYTIECPLRVGARLAGAGEEVMEAIGRFSRAIGVGYQLADDLIGVAIDQDEKSGTSDFEEGKQTILLAETLARVEAGERAWLVERFGRGPLGEEDGARVVRLYHESGAVGAVFAEVERLRGEAVGIARELSADGGLMMQLVDKLLPKA